MIEENLVLIGLDEGSAKTLGDLLLLLERLLRRGPVGVQLPESGEEHEAAQGGARRVQYELLKELRLTHRFCFATLSLISLLFLLLFFSFLFLLFDRFDAEKEKTCPHENEAGRRTVDR